MITNYNKCKNIINDIKKMKLDDIQYINLFIDNNIINEYYNKILNYSCEYNINIYNIFNLQQFLFNIKYKLLDHNNSNTIIKELINNLYNNKSILKIDFIYIVLYIVKNNIIDDININDNFIILE